MKPGTGSLKKRIKLINPWQDLSKINKITNEREEITANTTEIQAVRGYYKKNYMPKKWATC